jgi:hypothetical protein
MNNLITFLDGATYASLWSVGPILLSCLLVEEGGSVDTVAKIGRPTSSDQAFGLVATLFRPLMSPMAKQTGSVTEIWKSIPGHMSIVMVAHLIGHAMGSYIGKKRSMIYGIQRLCPQRLKNLSSSRVLSLLSSLLVSLLMINWGFGVATYTGWVMIRFSTAFISGGLVTWGERLNNSKNNMGVSNLELMEEGQPFISEKNDDAKLQMTSIKSSQMIWLNSYWLSGVAATVVCSGFMFYPLNYIGPHHKFFVFTIFIGTVTLIDRCMSIYYKTNGPSRRSAKAVSTFEDAGIVQMTASPNTGLFHRKKQPNYVEQTHQSHTPQRTRINSLSSVESEIFFDCMDDIELGFEDVKETNPLKLQQMPVESIRQNDNTNQIAIYSNRRVVYPDDTPAFVPAGEKISAIPEGYRALYKSKAHLNYKQTQQWRRHQSIHRIHARPHHWYPKIKAAVSSPLSLYMHPFSFFSTLCSLLQIPCLVPTFHSRI